MVVMAIIIAIIVIVVIVIQASMLHYTSRGRCSKGFGLSLSSAASLLPWPFGRVRGNLRRPEKLRV